MGEKLKPCNKCGPENFEVTTDFLSGETHIACAACGYCGPTKEDGLQAIAAWNTLKGRTQ